jgi:glutamate dehydrogenase
VTTKTNRRSYDARLEIIDAILASRATSRVLKNKSDIKRYLQQYFVNVPYEDLAGRDVAIMARIALDHLEFGAQRRRGEALLRIFNASEKEHGYSSGFTFVEMVNDDMPFLVDSVAAAINRQNLAVHITVHPIIAAKRVNGGKLVAVTKPDHPDAYSESFIRFAISRTTDEKVIRALRKAIVKTLSDVRLAVRDWGKMRQRMRETRDLVENGPKGVDPLLRKETQALLDWMVDEHFTFLGYREYTLSKRGKQTFLDVVEGSGLGILSKKSSSARPIHARRCIVRHFSTTSASRCMTRKEIRLASGVLSDC